MNNYHFPALFPMYVVPPPILSFSPPPDPVYAGSDLILNCSIQLSVAVDSEVSVVTTWRRNGAVFADLPTHIGVVDTAEINPSFYQSQLIFRPLQYSSDDAAYVCEVAVNSQSSTNFILNAHAHSSNLSIMATGQHLYIHIRKAILP